MTVYNSIKKIKVSVLTLGILVLFISGIFAADMFGNLGKNPTLKERLDYARSLYQDKKYDLALEAYRQIVRENPDEPMGYFGAACIYYVKENFSRAIANYKVALKYEPAFYQAYEWLGNAYLNTNNISGAVRSWKEAVKLNPGSSHISDKISTYEKGGARTVARPGKIEKTIKIARNIYDEGYTDDAISQLLRLEKMYPYESTIKFWISRMYIWSREIPKAVEYSKKVSSLRGTDVNLLRYIDVEEFSGYLEELDALLGMSPRDPVLLFYAASAYYVNTDDYDRAISLYNRAIENGLKKKGAAYIAIGNMRKEQGETAAAVEAYRKAIHISGDIEAHYQLGVIYIYEYGMPEKAGYHLNTVYKKDRDYKDIKVLLKERKKW